MKFVILLILGVLPIIFGQQATPATPTSKNTVQYYVTKTTRENACFIVEMSALVSVTYKESTKVWALNSSSVSPVIQKVEGFCGDTYQQIDIPLNDNGFLTIGTTKSNQMYRISLNSSINVEVNETFPSYNENKTYHLSINNVYNTEVPMVKYFSCINKIVFLFHNNMSVNLGSVTTDHLKILAFRTSNNHGIFQGPVFDCLADKIINNIVPLIVGVILAVLVVLVLITYLIGRRHTRSRYQTI